MSSNNLTKLYSFLVKTGITVCAVFSILGFFVASVAGSLSLSVEELDIIYEASVANGITDPNDFLLMLAIYESEKGPEGTEYGVMHPDAKGTNLRTQAGWAAATIIKNKERHKLAGSEEPFIHFFGNRWAPVGLEEDTQGLNRYWIKNVEHWFKKLKEDYVVNEIKD